MPIRFPKPPRREAKKPKPLKRTALKRRTKRVRPRSESLSAVQRRLLDQVWAHEVKLRSGKCLFWAITGKAHRCGESLDAHHVFGKKAHPELRHVFDNGVALCRAAHQWAHEHPKVFRREFEDFSPLKYDAIRERMK